MKTTIDDDIPDQDNLSKWTEVNSGADVNTGNGKEIWLEMTPKQNQAVNDMENTMVQDDNAEINKQATDIGSPFDEDEDPDLMPLFSDIPE